MTLQCREPEVRTTIAATIATSCGAQRDIRGLCPSPDVYGKVAGCGFLPGSRRRPHSGHAADTADIAGRTNAGGR
jgi:hypothetical protein